MKICKSLHMPEATVLARLGQNESPILQSSMELLRSLQMAEAAFFAGAGAEADAKLPAASVAAACSPAAPKLQVLQGLGHLHAR